MLLRTGLKRAPPSWIFLVTMFALLPWRELLAIEMAGLFPPLTHFTFHLKPAQSLVRLTVKKPVCDCNKFARSFSEASALIPLIVDPFQETSNVPVTGGLDSALTSNTYL